MPSNPKNTRRCAACRRHSDKSEMLRVCKNAEGKVFVDDGGNAEGRGAWVHRDKKCVDVLVRKKGLNAAFKTSVPEDVYNGLYERI